MNAFEKMIEDIFNIPQFQEYFVTSSNKMVTAICYSTDVDTQFTQFGVDSGMSFYLTCKCADYTPKKNQIITYRNTKYKIDTFSMDSFKLTYNIFLRDLTSK